jgi:hypothetical protein
MYNDSDDEIIGKKVRVKSCEARIHGDNYGCVCNLVGKVVKVNKKYKTPFVGTVSYQLEGSKQRVRRSEVALLKNQKKV